MQQKKILIIEDDMILLELLKDRLLKKGYNVIFERDGGNGFFTAKKEMPDLILLDLMLPKMDGLSILKELRKSEETKRLPVIIISNSGQPIEIEEIKNLGISDYLIKTEFNPDELLLKISNFFSEKSGENESGEESEKTAQNKSEENKKIIEKDLGGNAAIKILIIEDDKFLRELISQKIIKEGMNIVLTVSAEEAEAAVKKEKPTLILLDLILPGQSGFDFLKMIKSDSALSDIPVIILSNLGEEKDREMAKNLGAKRFLVKAMHTPNEIVREIKKVLNESYL